MTLYSSVFICFIQLRCINICALVTCAWSVPTTYNQFLTQLFNLDASSVFIRFILLSLFELMIRADILTAYSFPYFFLLYSLFQASCTLHLKWPFVFLRLKTPESFSNIIYYCFTGTFQQFSISMLNLLISLPVKCCICLVDCYSYYDSL